MAATKSISFRDLPTRRSVLAWLGGLALATPLTTTPSAANSGADGLILHDGWFLRPDDLARLARP
jgi:hypothetical protein